MTGLEKITDQILAGAKQEAEEILRQAKSQANEILAAAKLKAEEITAGIQKKSASDVESCRSRVASANDLFYRTETLRRKQEVIAQVIEAAYEKVCSMDAADYFEMLEKIIEKNALAQDGEICFSQKDLKRMPADFKDRISAAAKRAGGTLTLSKESRKIENGFVLVYGGMEENCTIRAIFDSRRDALQDQVNALLFS